MQKVGDKIWADGERHTITKIGRKWMHVTRDADGLRSRILLVSLLLHGDTTLYVA